ncbi:uncharacterized protein [Clytia hemisphaerica]|uniref:Uncharacterized protein n=1 Tax=Clytia hemisphaerica TaxID=252671 RepID=A0A7M5X052_9CNID
MNESFEENQDICNFHIGQETSSDEDEHQTDSSSRNSSNGLAEMVDADDATSSESQNQGSPMLLNTDEVSNESFFYLNDFRNENNRGEEAELLPNKILRNKDMPSNDDVIEIIGLSTNKQNLDELPVIDGSNEQNIEDEVYNHIDEVKSNEEIDCEFDSDYNDFEFGSESDLNDTVFSGYESNISTEEEEDDDLFGNMEDDYDSDDEELYPNCRINRKSFALLLKIWGVKHAIADKAMNDLLKIFHHVLPFGNGCPTSSYRLNKKTAEYKHNSTDYHLCSICHCPIQQNKCSNVNCPSHEDTVNILHFTIFDIKTQLIKIIKGYYDDIITFMQNRTEGLYEDICDGEVYKSHDDHNRITMVWHIDGAPTIKSKSLNVWLITAFVVELPIHKRFCVRNILFCGIWYGEQKPNFDLFQLQFVREVKQLRDIGFAVSILDEDKFFFLEIQASLADLPARAASLSLKQFNGKFGCPVCYHPGCPKEGNHLVRFYRYQENPFPLRTMEESMSFAERAEEMGNAFFGWKGKSVVLDITEIPYKVPFDYMHLILEGELKRKLSKFLFPPNGLLDQDGLDEINGILKQIHYPHDFSKKITSLNIKVVKRAKAGDLQLLLLHVLLPTLKDRIPDDSFCHLGLLVTSLQLLNQDSAREEDIKLAENMLIEYHRNDQRLHGDESQTFTNHALIHIADQRRKHGCPLVLISNFVFEGFIATLLRQYHGSRGIVPQMIKNIGYLQNIDAMHKSISQESTRELASDIIKKRYPNRTNIDNNTFMFGTISDTQPIEAVQLPNRFFNGGVRFSQRLWYKGNTYHSLSYKLKRNSNSYSVAYRKFDNTSGYGHVLFYLHCSGGCYMVIKEMKQYGSNLYSLEHYSGCLGPRTDEFILNGYLGRGFVQLDETEQYSVFPINCLIGRVLLIPINGKFYGSNVLNSYQHD